jgi:hypothetical protein
MGGIVGWAVGEYRILARMWATCWRGSGLPDSPGSGRCSRSGLPPPDNDSADFSADPDGVNSTFVKYAVFQWLMNPRGIVPALGILVTFGQYLNDASNAGTSAMGRSNMKYSQLSP